MAYISSNNTETGAKVGANQVAQSYADILYDHAGYLSKHNGYIAKAGSLNGRSIGIVGAGPAGLLSGTLLAGLGAKVTIYEATDRTGGRVYSYHPIKGDAAIFELGAMRVPPSERVFGWAANQMGLAPKGQFPDPGEVFTNIVFQNKVYPWDKPKKVNLPSFFDNVALGWKNLTDEWMANVGNNLFDAANFQTARAEWQKLLLPSGNLGVEQGYANISFYQGLVQAFVKNASHYGCTPWTPQEFALFGALGLGSGGFGPLYQVNFAEIARLVVNGLESNQQFYPDGLQSLTDKLASDIQTQGGSILTNSEVIGISGKGTSNGPAQVIYKPNGTTPVPANHDSVIVATTTRAMQMDMSLSDPDKAFGALVLETDEATALRELHLMNSSKLFVLTKSKFWNSCPVPANIQTDGLVRGLYCLDYPNSDHGVVLISYTWGDDSTKYIAIKDADERRELLISSLEPYVPAFVAALRADMLPQHTKMVDWQDEPHYYGAFKLNYPGQDVRNQSLYYQFLNNKDNPYKNKGVYLAGDSVGWCGGWIEGALQTGVNAASAAVYQLAGSQALHADNPMTQNPNQFNYGS